MKSSAIHLVTKVHPSIARLLLQLVFLKYLHISIPLRKHAQRLDWEDELVVRV